jgi:PAS domain S-box-containing protein
MSDISVIPPFGEKPDEPARPLRFVWQSDENGRISGLSPELVAMLGPGRVINGRTWEELIIDQGGEAPAELMQALARRDTWSGITIDWPVGDGRILVLELAGLPAFERDRTFLGFRGFGVVRGTQTARSREPLFEAPKPQPPSITIETMPEPGLPPEPLAPSASPPAASTAAPVVPFPRGLRPGLNPNEDEAFREIARALSGRAPNDGARDLISSVAARLPSHAGGGDNALDVLEILPAAVLIHRLGVPLFANNAFLDLTGFQDLNELILHGLDALFEELPKHAGSARGLGLRTAQGRSIRVEAHLKTIRWQDEPASLLFLGQASSVPASPDNPRERELRAILDTATDGVVVLDQTGRIISLNRGAEVLFGYDSAEIEGRSFTFLLGPDSHRTALDYLDVLTVKATSGDGREVLGLRRRGGALPLVMTLGRIGEREETRFCAIFRDITAFKLAEDELRAAKLEAERSSAHKTDFLARISHEIRTPLNAILGFAEVMQEEKLGPLGAPRYKEYLEGITQSGQHIVSLINDLLDLSKIEAGRFDLNFVRVNLNEIVSGAATLLQPQANRGRIIIRTSLAPSMPAVIADLRSIKQIALNLLSNAVKFTPPGGQVIVSTLITESGSAVLRVRDTGHGMSGNEIELALQSFKQLATNPEGGTGLGLPLTKAMIEANRAKFSIQSDPGAGTLVEMVFPANRVLPA